LNTQLPFRANFSTPSVLCSDPERCCCWFPLIAGFPGLLTYHSGGFGVGVRGIGDEQEWFRQLRGWESTIPKLGDEPIRNISAPEVVLEHDLTLWSKLYTSSVFRDEKYTSNHMFLVFRTLFKADMNEGPSGAPKAGFHSGTRSLTRPRRQYQ
jgi:hypothetical protein